MRRGALLIIFSSILLKNVLLYAESWWSKNGN